MQARSNERRHHGGELDQLARDLAEWRRTHGAPSPIPETVWDRAAALCAQHGVGCVARTLRLNYTHLKRRTEPGPGPAERTATFIELLPASFNGGVGECAMEVESPQGVRMRVVLKNVSSGYLAGVLREFVG